MKIGNMPKGYALEQMYNNSDSKRKMEQTGDKASKASSDTFELSNKSRDIKTVVENMKEPPVDMDRVNRIKSQIESGKYEYSPSEIAESMIAKMSR